jgi:hypothetical protein
MKLKLCSLGFCATHFASSAEPAPPVFPTAFSARIKEVARNGPSFQVHKQSALSRFTSAYV